jgi:hypothetical protein
MFKSRLVETAAQFSDIADKAKLLCDPYPRIAPAVAGLLPVRQSVPAPLPQYFDSIWQYIPSVRRKCGRMTWEKTSSVVRFLAFQFRF